MPPNRGLEQTAHRLRQGMRHLEQEAGLRERRSRAAAQAGWLGRRVAALEEHEGAYDPGHR